MYIPSSLYPTAYQSIVSRARASPDCTTFLLVSPDVDALCAARALAFLFKQDDVVARIHPVAGWDHVHDMRSELEDKDVRSLILINLGNLLNVYQLFDYLPTTALIHVLDSHRPIELNTLFQSTTYGNALFDMRRVRGKGRGIGNERDLPEKELTVVVWSDAEGDESREGVKEAWEAMQYEPASDSDDSDSDSDGDLPRGRRGGSGSDDEDDEDEDGVRVGKRRRTSTEPQPLSKAQRHRYRQRMDKYYTGGIFYGQSVAGQVFLLAVLLERADTDAVWLAILGLTHQFNTNAIDRERYEGYVALLSDEVARLSSTASSLVASSDPLASTGPNDRSIRPSEELRFCLFRHWNLYDSMYHSGYLGSKMKLWTERGRRNLSGMLAKMGCPLSESSEIYQHMATDLKNSLFGKIEALAPEYGLHDLIVPSFVRKSGYRTDIAAADAVEGVGALLEVATGVRLDFGNALGGRNRSAGGHEADREHGGREEWAEGVKTWVGRGEEKENRPVGREVGRGGKEGEDDEEESEELKRERRDKDWGLRNFWLAWDALDQDTSLLRSALPLSMALHRAVMDQGGYILEKQAIKSLRTYRLAIIKEGPDLAVFRHPSTLLRLALWLVDAVRDLVSQGAVAAGAGAAGKKPKSLPFVLASLNEEKDTFLVVGIIGAVEYGDVKKNTFSLAFRRAIDNSGSAARASDFESSVVEIRREHLDKFLKELALS